MLGTKVLQYWSKIVIQKEKECIFTIIDLVFKTIIKLIVIKNVFLEKFFNIMVSFLCFAQNSLSSLQKVHEIDYNYASVYGNI